MMPEDEPDPLVNIEAEQALLGSLLLNNDVLDRVANIVRAEDFSDPVHAEIFGAAEAAIRRGETASPVTLRSILADHPGLAELGGPAYLVRLAGAVVSLFAAADYARLVADMARRRDLRATLLESLRAVQDATSEPEAAAAKVETWSLAQAERGRGANVISFRRALISTVQRVNDAYQAGGTPGLRTGISALDDVTGGFGDGDMIVLGGRPGMGKSAIAQQIALNVARGIDGQPGVGVGIVSLEMNEMQIALRALSETTAARFGAPIPYQDIRDAGRLSEDQMRRVIDAAKALENLPIMITPPEVRSPGAIMGACRHVVRRFEKEGTKLGLLVVDYIQLMEAASRGNGNERVSELSNATKRMARQLGVPVLALAQLSREVERREDKRPQLADLRDSGAIEQDADTVIFAYREEYYLAKAKPQAADPTNPTEAESKKLMLWHAGLAATAGKVDLIVAKQRMGPTDTVTALCNVETNWIRDDARRPGMEGFL